MQAIKFSILSLNEGHSADINLKQETCGTTKYWKWQPGWEPLGYNINLCVILYLNNLLPIEIWNIFSMVLLSTRLLDL